MSNKTPLNTPPNKVPLWFTDEELNIIMQDINRCEGFFKISHYRGAIDVLKDKLEDEIKRRKELLKSLGGDE